MKECCQYCGRGCFEGSEILAPPKCTMFVNENQLIEFAGRQWCAFTLPMEMDDNPSPKASWEGWIKDNLVQDVFSRLYAVAQDRRTLEEQGEIPEEAIEEGYFIADCDEVVIPSAFEDPGLVLAGASFRKAQFWDSVDLSEVCFKDAVSFAGAIFKSNVKLSGAIFEAEVDFTGAVFEAEVDFSGARFNEQASFLNCRFEKAAIFSGTNFHKIADFSTVSFQDMADFQQARLNSSGLFSESQFAGPLSFLEASFGKPDRPLIGKAADWRMSENIVNFHSAEFQQDVMFGDAQFLCDAEFAQAVFRQQAYFKRVLFDQAVSFEDTAFEGFAAFNQLTARGRLLFRPCRSRDLDLTAANLEGVDLTGIVLSGATIKDTVFRDADLHDASITEVRHVLADQFAGTDVTGAALPPDIARFSALDYVGDASRYARNMFMVLLAACAYAWLAIATTRDPALVFNTGSSPLPILNAKVPIAGFFIVAPVLLLLIYIYFVLATQRLLDVLSRLPAYFPDGRPVHQHVHPWLINGILRHHFKRLAKVQPLHARLEYWITLLLLWGLMPLTVAAFWIRYLSRQDWTGTSVHILVVSITVFIALATSRLAQKTLRGETPGLWSWRTSLRNPGAYRNLLSAIMLIGLSTLVSAGLIYGTPGAQKEASLRLRLLPSLLESVFNYRSFPEFGKSEVQQILGNSGIPGSPESTPQLSNRRLRHLDARDVTLKAANFSASDLTGAQFQGADLSAADFSRAVLQGASFDGANLSAINLQNADLRNTTGLTISMLRKTHNSAFAFWDEHLLKRLGLPPDHGDKLLARKWTKARLAAANLQGAKLSGFDLSGAQLPKANLSGADLSGADLGWADFSGANLSNANLANARLTGANFAQAIMGSVVLTNARLGGANLVDTGMEAADLEGVNFYHPHPGRAKTRGINLDKAFLEGVDLQKLDLTGASLVEAVLTQANLSYARLKNTDFSRSDLRGVDFTAANLDDARFAGADLSDARGLTVEQLANACIDSETELPRHLVSFKRQCH